MPRLSINQYSVNQLQKLLRNRQNELTRLSKKRSKLQTRMHAIDRQIFALSGTGRGIGGWTGGGRARNEMSLVQTLEQVLSSGKAMRVSDIAEAVERTGYRSTSPNFRSIVNQTLIKERQFTSPSRGMYVLKK
jgi:hypothetical protein